MKKWKKVIPVLSAAVLAMAAWGMVGVHAEDAAEDTILDGIYIGTVDVGGMTLSEAEKAISDYADKVSKETVTLTAEENSLETTLSELGFSGDVDATVRKALEYGRTGNLVKRYKEQKDLEQEDKAIPLTLTADEDVLTAWLEENADELNQDAVNYGLSRENGEFVIIDGENGLEVNVEASVQVIASYFAEGWQDDAEIDLVVEVTEPEGTAEDLERVQDVLGTFSTDYSSSSSGRKQNVANGASLINGTVVYPGETFSVYEAVSPFDEENGYALAGSYENGTTVETYGGGICQVSTTLYNAVIRAELEVVERYGHSMVVGYVDPSADAAIAGTYKDLKFTNNTDAPIYIEAATDGSTIRFTIYGEETRPSNREVSFVSETTSTTEATVEYRATTGASIGTITKVQSSHTGKTARLWKIVTVDGVEESREVFNNTTYSMSPTIYEVGISSSSSEAVAAMKAAIATNDLSTIQAAAAQWNDAALQQKAEEEEKAAEEAAAAEAAEEEEKAAEEEASSESEESSSSSDSTESSESSSSEEDSDAAE